MKDLFIAALGGDEKSYREFLESTSKILRAYLLKTMNPRVRNVEQVEDLLQEVLISIHRKRDLFDTQKAILPWLFAIARYRLIDSLRTEARRPECIEWIEKFDALAFEDPSSSNDASGDEFMEHLGDRQKEILRLAKVEEIPLQEIADRYSMSLSAVKVTIHRSIKTIRHKLRLRDEN